MLRRITLLYTECFAIPFAPMSNTHLRTLEQKRKSIHEPPVSPFQMCTQLNAARSRTKPPPSRIIWPSINATTRRRIRFGTTSASNQSRALILSFSAMGIMLAWLCLVLTVRLCSNELDQIQMKTSGVQLTYESLQCLAFNQQCHCRMSSNTTHVLGPCVTRLRFYIMEILPLVSVALQPFPLREFFTLDPDCNRFFVRMAWRVSPLVYAAIVIIMFTNHCYHVCLNISVCATGAILLVFGLHELLENRIVAQKEDRTVPSTPLPPPPPPQE